MDESFSGTMAERFLCPRYKRKFIHIVKVYLHYILRETFFELCITFLAMRYFAKCSENKVERSIHCCARVNNQKKRKRTASSEAYFLGNCPTLKLLFLFVFFDHLWELHNVIFRNQMKNFFISPILYPIINQQITETVYTDCVNQSFFFNMC